MVKLGKSVAEEKINEFFLHLQKKTPPDVKKILKIAMSHNIKIKEKRKFFCKKCCSIFTAHNAQVRIKNKIKTVKCLKCNFINRWKIIQTL